MKKPKPSKKPSKKKNKGKLTHKKSSLTNCLVIGDMGKGTNDQRNVAKSMKLLYKQYKPKFVLGLGDNIYPNGCSSKNDPMFLSHFERPYSILPNHRWYMCLGNHDYGYERSFNSISGFKDNSNSQVDYTNLSKKWYMPSKYYSFVKGPVEFFYLDSNTDRVPEHEIQKQLEIMKDKLDNSNKKFKVVVGHHTWRSVAGHANAERRYETFLNDLFKDTKPNMYLCGHDHCKSLIVKDDGIVLGVLGTGGESYDNDPPPALNNMHDCRLDYFSPSLGAGILQIGRNNLTLKFFNEKGFCEYSHSC
jgi:tartrate-resistant acid phosphatase type 5